MLVRREHSEDPQFRVSIWDRVMTRRYSKMETAHLRQRPPVHFPGFFFSFTQSLQFFARLLEEGFSYILKQMRGGKGGTRVTWNRRGRGRGAVRRRDSRNICSKFPRGTWHRGVLVTGPRTPKVNTIKTNCCLCCLLWNCLLSFIIITGKARAKENTYKWVSV